MTLFLLCAVIALMAAAGVLLELAFRFALGIVRGATFGLQAASEAAHGLSRRPRRERAYA